MSIFLSLFFLVYPVHTDDVNTDGEGLFYNISPILPEQGTVYLLINPSLAYGTRTGPCDTSSHIPNDPRRKPVDDHYYGVGTVGGVGYAILRQLEVFLGLHGYGDYIQRNAWPLYRSDTRFFAFPQVFTAVKTGFPQEISPDYTLSFGFVLWTSYWVSALGSGVPHPDIRREFYYAPAEPQDVEIGIRGMTCLQSPIGKTFLNLGYFRVIDFNPPKPESRQFGFNSFGIGHELDLWYYVHPGIEVARQDTFGSLIPQVKFLFPWFTFNFGLSFPMFTKFDWVPDDTLEQTPRLMFTINPHIVIKKPPKPSPTIVIEGLVYDSLSLDPVPATISFMGPVSGKVNTKTGKYRLEFVKEGAYQIGVESPDFKWEQRVFHLMAYDTVHTDWAIKRKVNWSIMGKVIDVTTKKGVPAIVKLSGKKGRETYTDPATGEYKLWVNAGDYTLYVDAEGYHNEKESLKITNDRTIPKDIYLLPTQYPREAKAKFLAAKEKKGRRGRR